MTITLQAAALNLFVALACGAVIGSERQMRQRMAGLRTNALVALGAASFVTFSALYPTELSPTRVAAQIVSGIGFLGAGIIFRDGFNVHGLNTAATLWCSAGIGMLAGSGNWDFAVLLTGMVMFINLGLRPLVKWLKAKTSAGMPLARSFRVLVSVAPEAEGDTRSLMLRTLSLGGIHLSEIGLQRSEESGAIDLVATLTIDGVPDLVLEQAVQRLAAEPGLMRVRWDVLEDG
ncbi:MAG: MgtC/SapB family protein [Rhodobacter sp.]|nr:MgtC/SapB family protein [Rhodobacter sp.]MBK8440903.1 MgtC/SapB family protein [Rhodobacter sp.]